MNKTPFAAGSHQPAPPFTREETRSPPARVPARRLPRKPAIFLCALFLAACPDNIRCAESTPTPAAAEIELRKTFRSVPRAGRRPSRAGNRQDPATNPAGAAAPGRLSTRQIEAAAAAIGERLQTSGTLHLPGVGGRGVSIPGASAPVLETSTGRQVIIDAERTIPAETVAEITRLWPGYFVLQPPTGARLQEVIGSLLDAAGYDSVVRAGTLTLGLGVTIRLTPDFLVLRDRRDLLEGEMRAVSVVDRSNELPPELRELAGEHRLRIVELTADGAPVGADRAPWRESSGRVTTMESARPAALLAEIAGNLGLVVERRAQLPTAENGARMNADLRISRGGKTALVFAAPASRQRHYVAGRDESAILLESPADLPRAIGDLLGRFDLPAIGPTVEFYRPPAPGLSPRFVIGVPGWLAEVGGRRLLITGAGPPPLVRLYLSREGIDIFEYRIR